MKYGAVVFASAAATAFLVAPLTHHASAQISTPQTDWTKRVTVSEKGGHILGNPLARHQLVEYVSYTCNHCANFEVTSHTPLKTVFVAEGHINTEVRNYVRDPVDLTAAMLARCGGREKFFGNHKALMAGQSIWLKRVVETPAEVQKTWYEGSSVERMKKIAKDAQFYALMENRGYTRAQLNTCLADETAQQAIVAMTKYGQSLKITGTPSFTLGGKLIDKVHSWPSLKTVLTGLDR